MEQVKVLPFGARVRLSSVDMNGYWGRDLHPSLEDVGFLGVVVGNLFNRHSGTGMCMDVRENVPPGTVLRQDDTFGEDDESVMEEVMYTVIAPDGRKLECMWHELEELGSVLGG